MSRGPSPIPTIRTRPWWLAPGPILFAAVVLLASAAVLLQDVVFPPKPVDPRTRVVLPGGATFCDTVPAAPESNAGQSQSK